MGMGTQGASPRGRRLSRLGACAALLKSMVGSGLLAVPWALSRFGVVSGVLGLTILAILNVISIELLLHSRVLLHVRDGTRALRSGGPPPVELNPLVSKAGDEADAQCQDEEIQLNPYEALCTRALGVGFGMATTVAILLAQLGAGAAYVDIIVTFVKDVFPQVDRGLLIGMLFLVFTGLGFLRGLRHVSYVAMAGLLCYAAFAVVLVIHGVPLLASRGVSSMTLVDLSGIGWWYGISMFAFEGIGTVMSILDEMDTLDAPHNFTFVVRVSYAAALAFYCTVGVLGYACYLDETAEVILSNFPRSPLSDAAELALGVMLGTTFVVQCFPVHAIADALYLRTQSPATEVGTGATLLLRSWAVSIPCLIALYVPSVSTVVDVLGSTCFTFLSVIAPVFVYAKLFRGQLSSLNYAGLLALLAIGVLGGVTGLASAFR